MALLTSKQSQTLAVLLLLAVLLHRAHGRCSSDDAEECSDQHIIAAETRRWQVIGGIVGSFIFFAIVSTLVRCCCRRGRRPSKFLPPANATPVYALPHVRPKLEGNYSHGGQGGQGYSNTQSTPQTPSSTAPFLSQPTQLRGPTYSNGAPVYDPKWRSHPPQQYYPPPPPVLLQQEHSSNDIKNVEASNERLQGNINGSASNATLPSYAQAQQADHFHNHDQGTIFTAPPQYPPAVVYGQAI